MNFFPCTKLTMVLAERRVVKMAKKILKYVVEDIVKGLIAF